MSYFEVTIDGGRVVARDMTIIAAMDGRSVGRATLQLRDTAAVLPGSCRGRRSGS